MSAPTPAPIRHCIIQTTTPARLADNSCVRYGVFTPSNVAWIVLWPGLSRNGKSGQTVALMMLNCDIERSYRSKQTKKVDDQGRSWTMWTMWTGTNSQQEPTSNVPGMVANILLLINVLYHGIESRLDRVSSYRCGIGRRRPGWSMQSIWD